MGKKKPLAVILGAGGASAEGWHKIESFLRCAMAYKQSVVRGIRKPIAQTPDHFAIGTLFHAMRARWFSLRFREDWDSMRMAATEAAQEQEFPVSVDAERRALELMQLYIEHYILLPKPDPVAAEYLIGPSPLVEGDPYTRTARLDDVSRYPEAGGKLCIGESKTTSTSIADTVKQYELHGQPLLQLALWKMSPNGEAKYGPVAGYILDIAKKPYERDAAKFGRVFVPVNERVIDWYVKSMQGYLRAAALVNWDTEVPRNPNGCTFMAGRMRVNCDFKELCMHGRSATGEYVLKGGVSLLNKEAWKGNSPPWE